ncbi:MAG: hypothetical protein HeimC2_17550 [Candidatus Heimdallarchaeota archaeon LC_2]|nr:MAG: hypothetical protein HeimC2_17550 [Candidatus Heimdallarchaeota archaeon LC_2]
MNIYTNVWYISLVRITKRGQKMLDIRELQERFSVLIESRTNSRSIGGSSNLISSSPLRALGENLLNRFAYQLSDQAVIAAQKDNIVDNLLENVVSSLAIAGMMGINLEAEISNLLNLLESVSAEAS